MKMLRVAQNPGRAPMTLVVTVCLVLISFGNVRAHPLGNFTINHFTRLEVDRREVRIRYVVDMAEIPAFQELQAMGAADEKPTNPQLDEYLDRRAVHYENGLILTVGSERVQLHTLHRKISMPPGAGGLATLRMEFDFGGHFLANDQSITEHLQFSDENDRERIGWREIVVEPRPDISIFDSRAFGNALTDELRAYPQDMLTAPLNERTAQFSFIAGSPPAGARSLLTREGRPVGRQHDRLAELVAAPQLTPALILLSLLFAVLLGAFHALSPGHGKTIVGAYLVGSRGTARHAVFLGLTVTITHTAGVFALGIATLLASQYVVPERLFPILSFLSGAIVVAIGASLLIRRLRAATGYHSHAQAHDGHSHSYHENTHSHNHHYAGDPTQLHSHGGRVHSHLPSGVYGSPVTWRSLLALGISGGILPCPSALVVLLAAIALHRVGYGLLLVVAFSIGLAGVLTLVGLAFVYGSRFLKSSARFERLARAVPIASALVVTCAGLAICYSAVDQTGLNLFTRFVSLAHEFRALGTNGASLQRLSSVGMLGLGLVFGLKHATEVDHIVAVSAIVSEQQKLIRAAFVGGLWGAGHTASLIVVGVIVLGLRISIPDSVASWLEFGVAVMIISLGVIAFARALRLRSSIHIHQHGHGGSFHTHLHFHEQEQEDGAAAPHSHAVKRVGLKPAIVGAMHGLAGSAALTLLVLTQISSVILGLLYLAVFGLGSIAGMLLMSGLMGLPFALSSRRLGKVHYGLQMLAGGLSIAFGIWYAYVTGFASGLLPFTG